LEGRIQVYRDPRLWKVQIWLQLLKPLPCEHHQLLLGSLLLAVIGCLQLLPAMQLALIRTSHQDSVWVQNYGATAFSTKEMHGARPELRLQAPSNLVRPECRSEKYKRHLYRYHSDGTP
jgi:hypothetical protein